MVWECNQRVSTLVIIIVSLRRMMSLPVQAIIKKRNHVLLYPLFSYILCSLILLPNHKHVTTSISKEFADDKLNLDQTIGSVFDS